MAEQDRIRPEPGAIGAGEAALILAAERLFAERGVEGVSLRQVNQAANQKNTAAAHYHFGSRDGLVAAVLTYRLPVLDEKRGELLRRTDRPKDLRFYLEAFIAPLADQLRPREEGNFYIRFIQQYERHRGDYEFARGISPHGVEIYEGLERLLYYLPQEVRRFRIGYLINTIHSILAAAEERLARGELAHDEVELVVANMLDMIDGGLTAPLSVDTVDRLTRGERAAGGGGGA
jgi:AcrR family transcriptional regulator